MVWILGPEVSLQDLLESADFDFAGAPQVARNAQDGHREVFVLGAGDDSGTVHHAWEWPPNSTCGVNGNLWAARMQLSLRSD
jgi:hypothetical protein